MARILSPGGVVFLAEAIGIQEESKQGLLQEVPFPWEGGLAAVIPEDLSLRQITSVRWLRPLNVETQPRREFIIEGLTLQKEAVVSNERGDVSISSAPASSAPYDSVPAASSTAFSCSGCLHSSLGKPPLHYSFACCCVRFGMPKEYWRFICRKQTLPKTIQCL